MSKIDELIATTKLNDLIYKQEGKGNHYTMPIDIVMQENLPYYK